MTHSPAKVLSQLLIDLEVGTVPSANSEWPTYFDNEPATPDNVITTYNARRVGGFRKMPDGVFVGPQGVQVRVRGKDSKTGYDRTVLIAEALATVLRRTVTVEGSVYRVQCLSTISDVFPLGKESPTSKRNLFTLDMLMSVTQCS